MPRRSPLSAEALSRLLFETDPMHTCCRENDCTDEYDRVARDLADRLDGCAEPTSALSRVLSEWFGDGLVAEASLKPTLDGLTEAIQANLREHERPI